MRSFRVRPVAHVQETVFSETVRPLLPSFVLRATDACVFAYGQTGSGKVST